MSRREEGFVTVAVVALAAALALVAALVVALASVAVARHRAMSAADLAALAGARHALEGPAVACDAAREVAAAHGARVEDCDVVGLDVRVVAAVQPPGRLGELGRARAVARAGPGNLRGLGSVVEPADTSRADMSDT